jgi:hypothetical protein
LRICHTPTEKRCFSRGWLVALWLVFGAGEIALKIRAEKGVSYRTQFIATLRGTSLQATPRRDKGGQPLAVTGIYDREVGKVMAESTDLTPRYRLTGKELDVRARVISSKKHPNPFRKGDVEMAWVQPVVGAAARE